MNRLKTHLLLPVSAAFLGLSTLSHADTEEAYSGGYLGIRGGYSFNQRSCTSDHIKCDKEDSAYGVFAGYDFSPNWALEASYNDIGDSKGVYPNAVLDGELREADLALKFTYPAYTKARLFGKAGGAYWEGEVSGITPKLEDSGWRPMASVGLEVSLSKHLIARLEYQYIDNVGNSAMGYTNPTFASLGLVWNFSAREKPAPKLPPVVPAVVQEPEPPKPAPEQRITINEEMGGPLFEFDKSEIRNTAAIDQVVDILKRDEQLEVKIIGHTDSRGAADYNQRLSEARAKVVARYLETKGIAANRISVFGMGENQPVADNETDSGRAKNRRVEFVITGTRIVP
jgi:OOP family OmpA-OmpF porin